MTAATRHLLGAVAFLATGALAAACGPVHGNSASGGGSSPGSGGAAASSAPASPASSPAASHGGIAAAGCSSSALSARVDLAQGGAAAGSTYVPIDFTNTSGNACTMEGYPGVSFVRGPSGGQLGNAATRNPAASPAMVTLAPGGVAQTPRPARPGCPPNSAASSPCTWSGPARGKPGTHRSFAVRALLAQGRPPGLAGHDSVGSHERSVSAAARGV
jgi:uncharacterized protein DUF4232